MMHHVNVKRNPDGSFAGQNFHFYEFFYFHFNFITVFCFLLFSFLGLPEEWKKLIEREQDFILTAKVEITVFSELISVLVFNF